MLWRGERGLAYCRATVALRWRLHAGGASWAGEAVDLVGAGAATAHDRRVKIAPERAASLLRAGAVPTARSIVGRLEPGALSAGLSEQQALQLVARLIASGRLLVIPRKSLVAPSMVRAAMENSRAPVAAAAPESDVAAAPETAADPAPSLFTGADADVATQVAVLLQAAQDGIPFCEVCRKQAEA